MWLYVPSTCSPSAPAEADWSLPSSSFWSLLARSATWRGKSTRPLTLWRAFRKAPWTSLLFGATCEPSTLSRGADSWISSVRATRASLSVSPESGLDLAILGTFGPTFVASSLDAARLTVFSRTSQPTLDLGLTECSETSADLATRLRREYSARRKSARRIGVSGSSSWPTARVEDAESCGNHPGATDSLTGACSNWGTPTIGTAGGRGQESPTRGSRLQDQARAGSIDSEMWPTPKSARGDYEISHGEKVPTLLGAALRHWSTPTAHDARRPGLDLHSTQGNNLSRDAGQWYTPNVPNGGRSMDAESTEAKGATAQGKRQVGLESQTRHWPTPNTAPEAPNNGRNRGNGQYRDRNSSQCLGDIASRCSPQGPETSTDGEPSSRSTPKLNPRFVEWLMGWPLGWTDCGSRETEFTPWKARMRSQLYLIVCRCEWRAEGSELRGGVTLA